MTITIPRFEPTVSERGVKFEIDGKGVVIIKDHASDKIVAMANLSTEADKNLEIAAKIIEAIEEWITENEN